MDDLFYLWARNGGEFSALSSRKSGPQSYRSANPCDKSCPVLGLKIDDLFCFWLGMVGSQVLFLLNVPERALRMGTFGVAARFDWCD
jgi:hypothetical protein